MLQEQVILNWHSKLFEKFEEAEKLGDIEKFNDLKKRLSTIQFMLDIPDSAKIRSLK